MNIVIVHDATHANIGHLPPGPAEGYTTGTPDIAWTEPDWQAHPGAVRVCQDAGLTDATADLADVERYAGTNAAAARWYPRALAAYHAVARPGQRWPAIYTSASNVTPLVNELVAAGITSGPGLVVANWSLTEAQAAADVQAAAGPFPVVGVQWLSTAFYDDNVYSAAWLASVSQAGPPYQHAFGGRSVGAVAASRNMTVGAFVAEQQQLYPQGLFLREVAAYRPLPDALYKTVNP